MSKRHLIIFFALMLPLAVFCQKYNFVNWTVEDGLIQSQASSICQDQYRQLWIGTQGGISKFDGKKFTGYSVQDGLVANPVNVLFCDKRGNLWVGTNNGISFFNGIKFQTILPGKKSINNISAFAQDQNETVYCLNNFKLFKFNGVKPQAVNVTNDSTEKITALYGAASGKLFCYVLTKGLYCLQNNRWELTAPAGEQPGQKAIYSIFVTSGGDTLLGSRSGLYQVKGKKITLFDAQSRDLSESAILCFAEDSWNNKWVGTDKGIFKIEQKQLIYFDARNGFTDNSVNCIFNDAENNLWFATDADGIYKFRENTFTYYDKSSGFSNAIIMGVCQTRSGTIYAAGYGGGLYYLNSKNAIESVKNAPELTSAKINCLYADNEGNLWVGTLGKGAWQYNERSGLKKVVDKSNPDLVIRGATCFLKDRNGNILIGGGQGLYVLENNEHLRKLNSDNLVITSLKYFDGDSIMAGTSKGIFTVNRNYHIHALNNRSLDEASVLCLGKQGYNIWVGTIDQGVINWNYKTGKTIHYNTSNGLPSNFIYSIDVSEKNKAWIGTGFGISNLKLDEEYNVTAIKNYGLSDGLLGMECSHNGVLKASDSSLWFGTTKGLFHFNPAADITGKNQPVVLLKSVRLFSSTITDSNLFKGYAPWFNVPLNLRLKSSQNHLSFELGAIYFTNPDNLLYKYKLQGIDKDFTTSSNPYLIYPSLPPGSYTLNATCLTKNGIPSINHIEYSFVIEKAFYQTRLFQVLVVVLLITSGAVTAYIFTRGRQKRKQKQKEILEKIREEEFVKLRQRTAEDFHDEMGNSLTRISVLTDVLKSKVKNDDTEIHKIVSQIKENTGILYNGSRDIIWSLNSQNDGMYEIAEHIREIGAELFQETAIEFQYSHNISSTGNHKLKLDYSRNLTMIFKEAYSNILKHAHASAAIVTINLLSDNELRITISDNGQGFGQAPPKNGNGIRNMSNRVKRLNGEIEVQSEINKGTTIRIFLKNMFA